MLDTISNSECADARKNTHQTKYIKDFGISKECHVNFHNNFPILNYNQKSSALLTRDNVKITNRCGSSPKPNDFYEAQRREQVTNLQNKCNNSFIYKDLLNDENCKGTALNLSHKAENALPNKLITPSLSSTHQINVLSKLKNNAPKLYDCTIFNNYSKSNLYNYNQTLQSSKPLSIITTSITQPMNEEEPIDLTKAVSSSLGLGEDMDENMDPKALQEINLGPNTNLMLNGTNLTTPNDEKDVSPLTLNVDSNQPLNLVIKHRTRLFNASSQPLRKPHSTNTSKLNIVDEATKEHLVINVKAQSAHRLDPSPIISINKDSNDNQKCPTTPAESKLLPVMGEEPRPIENNKNLSPNAIPVTRVELDQNKTYPTLFPYPTANPSIFLPPFNGTSLSPYLQNIGPFTYPPTGPFSAFGQPNPQLSPFPFSPFNYAHPYDPSTSNYLASLSLLNYFPLAPNQFPHLLPNGLPSVLPNIQINPLMRHAILPVQSLSTSTTNAINQDNYSRTNSNHRSSPSSLLSTNTSCSLNCENSGQKTVYQDGIHDTTIRSSKLQLPLHNNYAIDRRVSLDLTNKHPSINCDSLPSGSDRSPNTESLPRDRTDATRGSSSTSEEEVASKDEEGKENTMNTDSGVDLTFEEDCRCRIINRKTESSDNLTIKPEPPDFDKYQQNIGKERIKSYIQKWGHVMLPPSMYLHTLNDHYDNSGSKNNSDLNNDRTFPPTFDNNKNEQSNGRKRQIIVSVREETAYSPSHHSYKHEENVRPGKRKSLLESNSNEAAVLRENSMSNTPNGSYRGGLTSNSYRCNSQSNNSPLAASPGLSIKPSPNYYNQVGHQSLCLADPYTNKYTNIYSKTDHCQPPFQTKHVLEENNYVGKGSSKFSNTTNNPQHLHSNFRNKSFEFHEADEIENNVNVIAYHKTHVKSNGNNFAKAPFCQNDLKGLCYNTRVNVIDKTSREFCTTKTIKMNETHENNGDGMAESDDDQDEKLENDEYELENEDDFSKDGMRGSNDNCDDGEASHENFVDIFHAANAYAAAQLGNMARRPNPNGFEDCHNNYNSKNGKENFAQPHPHKPDNYPSGDYGPDNSMSSNNNLSSLMRQQYQFYSLYGYTNGRTEDDDPEAIMYEAKTADELLMLKNQELLGGRPCNKDERLALALSLPFSIEKIVTSPIDVFGELIRRSELTGEQIGLVRDIRRRGKNKIAAQNCRKRKLDLIMYLGHNVDNLKKVRTKFLEERNALEREKQLYIAKIDNLFEQTFGQHLELPAELNSFSSSSRHYHDDSKYNNETSRRFKFENYQLKLQPNGYGALIYDFDRRNAAIDSNCPDLHFTFQPNRSIIMPN